MDDAPILNEPWPPDLDPADVPFRTRTVTILKRQRYFDDPSLFNTLTEAQVMSWWNAGAKTVEDIRSTGNEAIRRHHEQVAQLPQLQAAMEAVAEEPWAKHIWYRDPRFAALLPKVDATIYDIATTGSLSDKRVLWGNLDALRRAIDAQSARALGDAVAEYVAAISGQYGDRLEAFLARTGLGGTGPDHRCRDGTATRRHGPAGIPDRPTTLASPGQVQATRGCVDAAGCGG